MEEMDVLIQPIMEFLNQIEDKYPGLGIPTLYGVLSIMANKSVMFIGIRGIGKTRLINLIPEVPGTIVSKWDTFTYGELHEFCKRISDLDGRVRNKKLVFKVEEFSTFHQYHRQQFLTTVSKLISDERFKHITPQFHIEIENCQLIMLIAIQPKIYSDLCSKYTEWDSLSYDRFTKFLLINPLRTGTSRENCHPTLPEKMTHIEISENHNLDLSGLIELFSGHVSRGRAEIYALDYVRALAEFLGSEKVEQWHVDLFYRLFHPYLKIFSRLQRAEDLDSPVMVRTSHLRLLSGIGSSLDYICKSDLAEHFHVSERHIERVAKELQEKGLIEKPSSRAAKYCLSENLRRFFEKYRDGSLFSLMSVN
jgi:hypothetical protein